MRLSVIIPVFNEERTILEAINLVSAAPFEKEILVVDDASTDGTWTILSELKTPGLRLFRHEVNSGKGAAVRTGFTHAIGDVLIVQDADLEYLPADYPVLLHPIEIGKADVVFGSRFKGSGRNHMFWHYLANQILTLLTNILFNTVLTDMETGAKVFTRQALEGITIRSNRFNFEPEITAKVLKKNLRVVEVPIEYYGRGYEDGKKIGLKDAFEALWALFRYRVTN